MRPKASAGRRGNPLWKPLKMLRGPFLADVSVATRLAARMPADPDRSTCLRRAWTLHSRQIGIINKKLCYEKLACMPADLCVIFLFLLHSLLQIAWCGGRLVRLHRLCARRGKASVPSSFYVGVSVVPTFPSSFCSVFLLHYWWVRVGSRASFFERGGLYSCGLFCDHSCFPLAASLVVSRGAPGSLDCCWGGLPFLLC